MIDEKDREAIKLLVLDTMQREKRRQERQADQKKPEKSAMAAAIEEILKKYED